MNSDTRKGMIVSVLVRVPIDWTASTRDDIQVAAGERLLGVINHGIAALANDLPADWQRAEFDEQSGIITVHQR